MALAGDLLMKAKANLAKARVETRASLDALAGEVETRYAALHVPGGGLVSRSDRRNRRGRHKRDARGGNALGIALIGAAGLALAAPAGAATFIRLPPLDPDTGCRLDQPLAAHTLVLVDATDRFEARHVCRLRAALQQERDRLARFGRLTIIRIDASDPREPRRLVSLCDPGDGNSVNALIANTGEAQRRWERGFTVPVDDAIAAAGRAGGGASSPIVEALATAASEPDFGPEIAARRLVLASDLLEHHPGGFRLFLPNADFAGFKASADGLRGDLALRGIDVRIIPIDREDQAERQHDAIARFWVPLLAEAGAASVTFDATPAAPAITSPVPPASE